MNGLARQGKVKLILSVLYCPVEQGSVKLG